MDSTELKEFRSKHGLNQSQLAEIAGVKVGTVQSWEQDKRNVGQSAIKLLHEYESKKAVKERSPQSEVRLEDLIAKGLLEELKPYLKDFQEGHISTGKQVHELTEIVKSIAKRIVLLHNKVEQMENEMKEIKIYCKDMHEVVSSTK